MKDILIVDLSTLKTEIHFNRVTPELKYFEFSQLILGYKQTFTVETS